MSEYPNSGGLFPNNDREPGKNHPHTQGKATTTCAHCGKETEFWLSGWTRQMKAKNAKWISLAFRQKDEQPNDNVPDKQAQAELDDDIPF